MARSAIHDPLEKFRFLVSWSNSGESESTANPGSNPVVGFHDIQSPKRTTNKGTYREGDNPDVNQLFAGLSNMEDVVLSKGVLPMNQAGNPDLFYSWMSAVHNPAALAGNTIGQRASTNAANSYRKDVTITMLDREGNEAKKWILYNAFPSHFTPGSDMNAREDGDKSIEALTLAYEDFQELQVSGGPVPPVSPSTSA